MQVLFPLLLLLLNVNCRLANRSNLPVEQKQAQTKDSASYNESVAANDVAVTAGDTSSSLATRFGVMVAKSGGRNIPPERQAR